MTNPRLAVSASVVRYLLALDALKSSGGIRTIDVARHLNVKKSSAHTMLNNLRDVTICSDDLESLVTLKRIADGLMARIHANYRFIISFNTGLIVLGVAGVLPPYTSALLHNVSTLGIGLRSMKNLLP